MFSLLLLSFDFVRILLAHWNVLCILIRTEARICRRIDSKTQKNEQRLVSSNEHKNEKVFKKNIKWNLSLRERASEKSILQSNQNMI